MVVVGGRLCCLSCFFSCSSVLLVGVCLLGLHASAYVEASSCQRVIHKKVGDTVELPSCSPREGVSAAVWRYGESRIADKDYNISGKQFQGRLFLNPTNFSLTLRELMASDSGNFSFISTDKDGKQRETFTVTLHVHEPITERPVLNSSIPRNTLNKSCTVYLGCSTTTKGHVTYTWSVRNQTTSGSRLQYDIKPQDGETEFTCTISNHFSNMSASTTFKCEDPQPMKTHLTIALIVGAGVSLFIVILVGVAVWVCCRQSPTGSDSNDLTVYADISEITIENDSTMKPCSVYETVDKTTETRLNTVGLPQTVYDQIQFNRMKKPSLSPYQDIS
uniref:SLAM family member 8-like isoform X1 n=1 Tax=Scatophagus argus TaxID=75038 RepID=UPI001ED855A0|nr:SLAM family member 8-like isoform X1 [Scatophagus argus]